MKTQTPAEAARIDALCNELLSLTGSTREGLPEAVFLLASQLTPLVNVDLLIRNAAGQTLLTWRDDAFCGPGWHVPGGIVRFKETFAQRIEAVAASELGCRVRFAPTPCALNEIQVPHRDVRGHFISLLFDCQLLTPPSPALKSGDGMPTKGQWQWHDRSPDSLIRVHAMYRPYIDAPAAHWQTPADPSPKVDS
ncbi:NUDIX hydrolase [Rhodocyclus tenuis]|uniref:NUDIX hydrolase n=1 Tax=Rhodocyclus gracilis TaxID=2929842 RepID=A0ABX0WHX6_9RHOO|nr:NUDIX hydrolase [Rhodocyclus gracilis]NJA89177.1 NUDIX hydrolase [Rhodocyclus gracilis]